MVYFCSDGHLGPRFSAASAGWMAGVYKVDHNFNLSRSSARKEYRFKYCVGRFHPRTDHGWSWWRARSPTTRRSLSLLGYPVSPHIMGRKYNWICGTAITFVESYGLPHYNIFVTIYICTYPVTTLPGPVSIRLGGTWMSYEFIELRYFVFRELSHK